MNGQLHQSGGLSWLMALLLCTGCCCCHSRFALFPPPPEHKTIEQLYYEALAQSRPEVPLGLQTTPHADTAQLPLFPLDLPAGEIVVPIEGTPTGPEGLLIEPEFGPAPAPPPPLPDPELLDNPNVTGGQKPGTKPVTASRSPAGQWQPAGTGGGTSETVEPKRIYVSTRARKRGTVEQVAYFQEEQQGATSAKLAEPKLINEFFEDTDIRQAIQSMATQAGERVVMDEPVSGVVSAVIEDEPFEAALQKLLLPLGFVYKKTEGGDFLIGTTDPASPMFPRIAEHSEYRPHNISPQELLATLPERLKPFVRVVDKRNIVLIEAPSEIAVEIKGLLERVDTPIPQVMLEAIICVVAPDSAFRFGLDWSHAVQLNGTDAANIGLSGLALNAGFSPTGLNNSFNDFAFTSAFVQMLAQEGYLTIRASPRVMARDGERAEISIARQTFFSIQPQSADVFFRQDIREVEAGIDLIITPTVRGDNVQVNIEKAEVSEDIRSQQTDPELVNNPFPLINRRRVTTNVTVKDGQTIVIGGLVSKQTVDRLSEIPGLGRIPKLGTIFKKVEKQEQEAEVVIFISPKIITTPGSVIVAP